VPILTVMAEDDIDLDALQAQIDISNAFMNELVSSWVTPTAGASTSHGITEKEFEEMIRRPPRCLSPVTRPFTYGKTQAAADSALGLLCRRLLLLRTPEKLRV
jgi:hypothetical protein